MSDPVPKASPGAQRRTFPRALIHAGCLVSLIFLLTGIAMGQLPGLPQARRDALMQQTRLIAQMLLEYATDNIQDNSAYPDGKSSTEIFQKLIDGGYCTDPSIFYTPLPGKVKPVAGQKLKPENVCFDATSGVDADASDGVPLVFVTGYKVTYGSGAAAAPLTKSNSPAMIVVYKSNSAKVLIPAADGSIANFIPASFDPKGKTYRQLTPDGPLPP